MEDFVIVVLVIAVLWLFVKLRRQTANRKKLEQHSDLIGRLHQRVTALEQAAAAQQSPVAQQAAAPVVRGGPFPASSVQPKEDLAPATPLVTDSGAVPEPVLLAKEDASGDQASFAPQSSSATFLEKPSGILSDRKSVV